MGNMKYFRLLLLLVYLWPAISLSKSPPAFSGKWEYNESVDKTEKPYSILDLSLEENGDGDIRGSYCFVTHFGNKIDCSPDPDVNMIGRATESGRKVLVTFSTFFGAKNGVVELSINDDGSLTWNIIKWPQGAITLVQNVLSFEKLPQNRMRTQESDWLW
jgi:hypothetical protein